VYRLKVISGPQKGKNYSLTHGQNRVGRSDSNQIVLASTQVSKDHCLVHVEDNVIRIIDRGSSNGVFVNGVKAKDRKVAVGDLIKIGDFVLELKNERPRRRRNNLMVSDLSGGSAQNNVIAFPTGLNLNPEDEKSVEPDANAPLIDKVLFKFEKLVMPLFYRQNIKYDLKSIGLTIILGFILLSQFLTVVPVQEEFHQSLVREAQRRARFIAKQIVEKNAVLLREDDEGKVDVAFAEEEQGVLNALLISNDKRIIAPREKHNQYLAQGVEASVANFALEAFKDKQESGIVRNPKANVVVAVEPLKLYNPLKGKNEVVAAAVVSIDISRLTPDFGAQAVSHSSTFIVIGLIGIVMAYILFRLFWKRFELLNNDLDRVLKGQGEKIGSEFKFEEAESLWEIINSLAQIIPRKDQVTGSEGSIPGVTIEDFMPALQVLSEHKGFGVCAIDTEKRLTFYNSHFELITGFRLEGAIGQSLSGFARDQSLIAFIDDLSSRCQNEKVTEDYEFSGTMMQVSMVGLGAHGRTVGYLLTLTAKPESDEDS
jgi:hypothetical protein